MIIKKCPACRMWIWQGKTFYDCEVDDNHICSEIKDCFVKEMAKRLGYSEEDINESTDN